MADIKPTISIIILNVKGLNTPIRDRDCQSTQKRENKIQLYVAYKKSTLNIRT